MNHARLRTKAADLEGRYVAGNVFPLRKRVVVLAGSALQLRTGLLLPTAQRIRGYAGDVRPHRYRHNPQQHNHESD